MEFSRQECWSGLPFSSPGDLPNPEFKPRSPTLQADALPSEPRGKPQISLDNMYTLQVVLPLLFPRVIFQEFFLNLLISYPKICFLSFYLPVCVCHGDWPICLKMKQIQPFERCHRISRDSILAFSPSSLLRALTCSAILFWALPITQVRLFMWVS